MQLSTKRYVAKANGASQNHLDRRADGETNRENGWGIGSARFESSCRCTSITREFPQVTDLRRPGHLLLLRAGVDLLVFSLAIPLAKGLWLRASWITSYQLIAYS